MADLTAVIETYEHRWMRAWMGRDSRALKSLTSPRFVLLMGSKPPMILDGPSWLEAAAGRYSCKSYRFGDVYVRDIGGLAIFSARMDIEAEIDGRDWSGPMWVTDLWKRGKVRRSTWRMAQRVLSRPEEDAKLPAAILSLQLWR